MSKISRSVLPIFATFLLILQFFTFSAGQDIEATIRIDPNVPNTVLVKGRFLTGSATGTEANRFVLLNDYAGIPMLAKRFANVRLFAGKEEIECVRGVIGEYRCGRPVTEFWYRADLLPAYSPELRVHASWIKEDYGVLVIDDLLPQGRGKSARVTIEMPPEWQLSSNGAVVKGDVFEIPNIEKTVFVIGKNWRRAETRSKNVLLKVLLAGTWRFSEPEAAAQSAEIYSAYETLFASDLKRDVQIAISDISGVTMREAWLGGTRGSSVLLASTDMPFRAQSLQRLHEQLRHEIFHLWLPNGVNLTGNYDWFYEGFALYQSLKLGVAVNRIRFDDYLDTLSRAYAIDSASPKRSLVEASKERWNGSDTTVYARGMLVAFLCDLALLDATKGKRSTSDLLRELYARHSGTAAPQDANTAILTLMREKKELAVIADRYINGSERIDLGSYVNVAGIEVAGSGSTARLGVSPKPSGRQKDLLDKLGYNNWRKLAGGK